MSRATGETSRAHPSGENPYSRVRAAACLIRRGCPPIAAQTLAAAGSFRDLERTLDLPLQEQDRVLDRQPVQRDGAHLTPEAPVPRGHHEGASRGHIDDVFQLLLREVNIVKNDQSLLFVKAMPYLGVCWFADRVALVEGFEDELQDVVGRLMSCPHIDDAVRQCPGSRMMGQVSQQGCLADARLAARFDGKPCVKRREGGIELVLAIDQAADQSRAEEDRRGSWTKARSFGG